MHRQKSFKLNIPTPFSKSFSQEGYTYFETFFNFMYYFLFAPFKVKTDGERGEFILKQNRFQQVLCAAVHLVALGLGIFYMVIYLDVIFTSPDVSLLLYAVGSSASYIGVVITIKVVWLDRPKILRMIKKSRVKTGNRGMMKAILLSLLVCLCGLNLCMSLFSAFGTEALSPAVDMSLGKIAEITEQLMGASESWALILLRKAVVFTLKILLIQATNLYNISRIVVLVSSLAFLAMGMEFENSIRDENSLKNVIQNYDFLCDSIGETNGVVGNIMLVQYIGVLSFVANSPSLRNGHKESMWVSVEKYYLTLTYAVSGAFLIVGCDTPKRIHMAWKNWMIKKRLKGDFTVDERFMMVIFNQDVESETLGLSCVFFTITYRFLGSMIGLVTTYGILVYQFKQ